MKIFFGHLMWAALLVAGCNENPSAVVLYPIDSLVSGQIAMLSANRAELTKVATLGNVTDQKAYIPNDSAAWDKELDVFRQLEAVNKPINKDNYIIDNELYDPSSNLTVKAFTAKVRLPVRSMRIYFDKSPLRPRKIEALFEEENTLYTSSQNLSLEFEQVINKNVLTYYSIQGGQKMAMSDSVTFFIRGKIQLDKAK